MPLPTNRINPPQRKHATLKQAKPPKKMDEKPESMDAGDFDAPVSDESIADANASENNAAQQIDDSRLEFTENSDQYNEGVSDSDIGSRLDQSYDNAIGVDSPQASAYPANQPAAGGYNPMPAPQNGQPLPNGSFQQRQAPAGYGQQPPMQQYPQYDAGQRNGYAAAQAQSPADGMDQGYGYAPATASQGQAQRRGYGPDDDPSPEEGNRGNGRKNRRSRRGKKEKGGYDRKRKSAIKSNNVSLSASHAKAWRWTIITMLIIIGLLGAKEAVFPAPSITPAQVQQMIYQQTGTTKFPLDRGAAVAKAFIASYIPISGDPAAASMLDNFYSGTKFKTESDVSGTNSAQAAPSSSGEVNQVIQSGPYVYKQRAVSDNTANYVIGTLVYRRQHGQPVMSSDGKTPEYKWLYFNVGIYWDEKTDKLAIDTNSPTVTSAPEMRASASLPATQLPGDGKLDQDATDQASDTITNFMKAWSQGDESSLKTLTAHDKTAAAMNGLDGTLSIKDMSTMKISVYGHPPTDQMYRALVEMKWSDIVSNTDGQDNGVQYNSKYILKLEKTSEGKFLVQDINPYYYVPDHQSSK